MSEEFELDWLDLREPHDAAARSEALAEALIARLPARPRLMDLGAGTGSLFRWLAPRIGRAQAWTLVDQNREMTEAAFDTIADRAEQVGLKVTFPNRRTLLVHAPGGAWRVEALIADLAHAPDNLPLQNADAVVCSALCDLVSAPWLARMAAAIRVPFYAGLNVDGRDRFLPPVPGDALVARGFARDQGRDKGFGGRALGAKAAAEIARAFGAQGYQVQAAASDWVLRGGPATSLLSELVFGHAEAAIAQDFRHAAQISAWRERRLQQGSLGRLQARIGHRDVLALPPEAGWPAAAPVPARAAMAPALPRRRR